MNEGQLPDLRNVCEMFRKKNITEEIKATDSYLTCMWFLTQLVPCVSSKWRHALVKKKNTLKYNDCVTISDEAFTYRTFDLYAKQWKKNWTDKQNEGYKQKYKRYKKTNHEGNDQKYLEYFELVKNDRADFYELDVKWQKAITMFMGSTVNTNDDDSISSNQQENGAEFGGVPMEAL